MKKWKVREWPAPAYNAKSARRMKVSCCALIEVECRTKKEAIAIARDRGMGSGRSLTASVA